VPSLRSIRLHRMLTQVDLSELSGVSQGTITRIEKGRRPKIALRTAKALAAALQVDPRTVDEFKPSLGTPPELMAE
jgi:transcriptional regulator with XRE-family HTH domain